MGYTPSVVNRKWYPKPSVSIPIMASPPTVGAKTTVTGIVSPTAFVPSNTSASTSIDTTFFTTLIGNNWTLWGPTSPDYRYIGLDNSQGATLGSFINKIEFFVDCTTFEFLHKGTTGNWRMWVDDQLISEAGVSIPNDGSTYFQPITFGSKALRKITLEFYRLAFGGIYVGATDAVYPSIQSNKPKGVVFSDSYGESTGASNAVEGYINQLSAYTGIDFWAAAQGGSGVVAGGSYTGNYATRVAGFSGVAWDYVVIQGSVNDFSAPNNAALAANMSTLLGLCKRYWPTAKLVVVGPPATAGVEGQSSYAIPNNVIMKAAAATFGATFINLLEAPNNFTVVTGTQIGSTIAGATSFTTNTILPIGATIEIGTGTANAERRIISNASTGTPSTVTVPALTNAHNAGDTFTLVGKSLWTGTGKVGATTGSGSGDLDMASDGIHPTTAGHKKIARNIAMGIAAA